MGVGGIGVDDGVIVVAIATVVESVEVMIFVAKTK